MFEVLTPPDGDQNLANAAKEILNAASELSGKPMDVEGFIYSWIAGTRVVVERDDTTRKITGLGIFTAGKQWPHIRTVAHVLRIDGNRDGVMGFIISMCKAIGVDGVYVEDATTRVDTPGEVIHTVREIVLKGG